MARQQARRHHRERLAGFVLAVLGVVVLVVAILAITEPKDATKTAAGTSTAVRTVIGTSAPTSPSSPPASTRVSSTPKGGGSLSLGGTSPASSADTAAKKTPIVVLNNTTTSGLAMQAAARFRAGGWTVSDTGNLKNDIASTCAYYDPSASGAETAAKALRQEFPTIKRVTAKFPELPPGPVVVVLTPDYTSN